MQRARHTRDDSYDFTQHIEQTVNIRPGCGDSNVAETKSKDTCSQLESKFEEVKVKSKEEREPLPSPAQPTAVVPKLAITNEKQDLENEWEKEEGRVDSTCNWERSSLEFMRQKGRVRASALAIAEVPQASH